MKNLAIILLFAATTAAAQVVDTAEQTFGPWDSGPQSPPALAVTPNGLLLAWSEVDPVTRLAMIRIAPLDFALRQTGPAHTFASLRTNQHATTPSIATDGTTFFVAWVERDPYTYKPRNVSGVLTGTTGAPIGATETLGSAGDAAPALIWTGLEYRYFGAASHAISPLGAVTVVNRKNAPQRVPFATPDANGWVDWVVYVPPRMCGFGCHMSPPSRPVYILTWDVVTPEWIRTGSVREHDTVAEAPAVTADGKNVLIVWSDPSAMKAFRIIDGEATEMFRLADKRAIEAKPAVAGSLVVFEHKRNIFGSIVTGNSFGPVFPISDGPEDDSTPGVHAIGHDRYLVSYVRDFGGSISFVTRIVNAAP